METGSKIRMRVNYLSDNPVPVKDVLVFLVEQV